jgi:predicted secreted protein
VASFAFTDASVTINSVDLSDHVRSVTLNIEAEDLEDTAMGDTFRSRIGGLKDWSIDIEFNQDFAASEVDATIFPLLGTVVAVEVRPTSSPVSATNPKFSGNVLVSEYNPLDGSVGDLATTSVSWPGAGALTRATS